MSNNKKLKEYIYLDNIEINSLLAQFEDGIPQVIQSIRQSGLSNTSGSSSTNNKNANVGANAAIFKGNVNAGNSDTTTESETSSEMSQEAISTVYSDYAVDIVTKELDKANLLKTNSHQEEGSYVQLSSNFNIIDSESMGAKFELAEFERMMSHGDGELDPEAHENLESLFDFSNLINKIFPESILLKTKNALTIGETKNFRMNSSQLRMLSMSKRKIVILGKIESIAHKEDIDPNSLDDNGLNKITSLFSVFGFYVMSMITDFKPEDRLIKPLAIYFE